MIAADSSGNGYDLFYSDPYVVYGVSPGYVTGDVMVQNVVPTSGFVAGSTAMDMSSLTGNDLFFNVWTDLVPPSGGGPAFVAFLGDDSSTMIFDSSLSGAPPGSASLSFGWNAVSDPTVGIVVTDVFPAGRHMISVRLDISALGGQFYLDGAPFGSFQLVGGPMPNVDTTGTLAIGGKSSANSPFYDEIAIGAQPTSDADFANLYAQAGDFDAYNSAQMAMGPEFYYHLNEEAGWNVGFVAMGA